MRADCEKVVRYLKTARGQLDGIMKMVEDDRYCIDIADQLFAVQALLRKTSQEVLAAHLTHCVQEATAPEEREEKIREIIGILEKMNR